MRLGLLHSLPRGPIARHRQRRADHEGTGLRQEKSRRSRPFVDGAQGIEPRWFLDASSLLSRGSLQGWTIDSSWSERVPPDRRRGVGRYPTYKSYEFSPNDWIRKVPGKRHQRMDRSQRHIPIPESPLALPSPP